MDPIWTTAADRLAAYGYGLENRRRAAQTIRGRFNGNSDRQTMFGPRPVVVPDVRVTKEFVDREPIATAAFTNPTVCNRRLGEIDTGLWVGLSNLGWNLDTDGSQVDLCHTVQVCTGNQASIISPIRSVAG